MSTPDGRLRKGALRRAALVEATVRCIARGGIDGVTQRSVAREAEVPASAVLYYFRTVEDLLVATLVSVNDRWIAALDALRGEATAILDGLAELLTTIGTAQAVAEYELWLFAARRPHLRSELQRWWAALEALATRADVEPEARDAFVAGIDGLCVRMSLGSSVGDVRAVLACLAGAPAARP